MIISFRMQNIIQQSIQEKLFTTRNMKRYIDVNMCFPQRKMIKMTNYDLMVTEMVPIPNYTLEAKLWNLQKFLCK